MKTIKQIFFVVLLSVSYKIAAIAQNLNSMPAAKRDSILISIAKEAIMKYGQDYYREYKKPTIKYEQYPSAEQFNDKRYIGYAGRYYYNVTFPYDTAEETLEWDYAAKVSIWASSGNLHIVTFGNGFGRHIPDGMDWRNDTSIEPIPYQDATRPGYDINTYYQNPDPINKEELIRKGWVKNSDGQWVKTRPDTPPAAALQVIQRAKDMMKMDNR